MKTKTPVKTIIQYAITQGIVRPTDILTGVRQIHPNYSRSAFFKAMRETAPQLLRQPEDIEAFIPELLSTGPLTCPQLIRCLNAFRDESPDKSNVYRALNRLIDAGRVSRCKEKTSLWIYRLVR